MEKLLFAQQIVNLYCDEFSKETLNCKSFPFLSLGSSRHHIEVEVVYASERYWGQKKMVREKVRMGCINRAHQNWGILHDKQLSMILRTKDACGREVCWPGEPQGGRRESEILLREKVQNEREIFQAEWRQ